MPTNFTLTLPSVPVATSFLQIDTSGNITAGAAIANGIGTSNIATNAVTNNELALGLQMLTGNLGSLSTSGSVSMNVATANAFYVSCTAPLTVTINLSNFIDGQCATIMVNANGNAVTVNFNPPSGLMKYQGATQIPQTIGLDIYTVIYNAITGNYYVAFAQDY
jgi:hypothetical protein